MEYVVSVLWIAIELLSMFYICHSFLEQRYHAKRTVLIYVLGLLLVLAINLLKLPVLEQSGLLRLILRLGVCIALSALCFRWKWYGHVLLVSLFYFLLVAVDTLMAYGASSALGISVSELVWRKWLYVAVITVGKCMLLLACFLVDQHRNRKAVSGASGNMILRMALFPMMSILLLYFAFENYKNLEDLSVGTVLFTLILVGTNAAVLMILRNMERSARAEQELALLHQSMALQSENILSLEKSYRAQRSASHEYSHQLQTVSDLLDRGEVSAAKSYLAELQQGQSSRIFAVNTHHLVIDVVLNEKYHQATEKGIDVHFRVNDLSGLNLPADALVVLLSNLLDNAIEACEKVTGEKRIDCSLLLEDSFTLSVRNSSLPVTIRKDTIATTKTPPAEHGFGLPAIKRILEEWQGESAMQYQDGFFSFVAEIPLVS